MRKRKKKFNILDFLITVLVTLVLSSFVVPYGISYLLSVQNKIPNETKKEILMAGKKYLEKNNTNKVSLEELINYGYLDENYINNSDCFTLITTIHKSNNNKYSLNLKCINDSSTLTLLE